MGLKSIPMPAKGDFTMKSHQRVLRGPYRVAKVIPCQSSWIIEKLFFPETDFWRNNYLKPIFAKPSILVFLVIFRDFTLKEQTEDIIQFQNFKVR